MEQKVTLEGKEFSLVRVQRSNTAIYRCGNLYLRLGEKGELARDLALHEQMIAYDFPVAQILSKGEYKSYLYFIEESLGGKHFGQLFSEDIKNTGNITKENFESFLNITKKFAISQLATSGKKNDIKDFADGIHLDIICEELPDVASQIRKRFSDAIKNLSAFPFVVT
ncbi:MAG: hypothetical protein HY001_04625, partial [Candidatus Portnoybacteria bacterium]|nr:hypothetical protein [Candidatus Portnoybacteria bacterium]